MPPAALADPGLRADRMLLGTVAACSAAIVLLPGLRRPLWLDEAASAQLAALPHAAFWRVVTRREGNGVAHTLLLRGWRHVVDTDLGLRVPSLVFSALALLALTALARNLFDRRTALLAAPLLLTNPLYLRYAVEARTYALVLLAACLSGLLLLRALRLETVPAWMAYAAVSGLAVYAHYFALLLPLGHGLGVLLRRAPLPPARALGCAAVTYLVSVSGLALLVNGAGASGVGYLRGSPFVRLVVLATAAAAVAGVLLAAGLGLRRRATGRPVRLRAGVAGWPWVFASCWLLGPIAAAVGYSVLVEPVLAPRYLVICLPPAVLLLAATLAPLASRRGAAAVVAGAVVLLAGAGGAAAGALYIRKQTEQWPQAAAAVARQAGAGDGVLFDAPYVRLPFERYWPAAAERRRHVDPLLPALPWGNPPTPLFFEVSLPPEQLAGALRGRARVWLVLSHVSLYGGPDPVYRGVLSSLRSVMHLTQSTSWRGVTVQRWER